MQADVELDEQLRGDPAPVEGTCQALGRLDAVHGDGELDAGRGEVGEPLPLRFAERRVVDEQPRYARFLEHLRLAGLGNGEAGCAEVELAAADLR